MDSFEKLSNFGDREIPIIYKSTQTIKEGVECDVYSFDGDPTKDLAIVRVSKGAKTPLQRVISGTKTIEGFIGGKGTLSIQYPNGKTFSYNFGQGNIGHEMIIDIGQIMQWSADGDSDLVFYEICQPPYEEGRFENLTE